MAKLADIRRSPIVLIRMFVAIEAGAFLCYLSAAALGNYKYEVYSQLFLAHLVSYQIAKFLFLAGVQFAITVYAFLRWYYDIYHIEPQMISHEWGVFFKRRMQFPLKDAMSVTLASDPLGKRLHYGSIHIQNTAPYHTLTLHDISYPETHAETIAGFLERSGGRREIPTEDIDVPRLLKNDEHENLEFKSSLRFDYHKRDVNPELEKAVIKTVAAFLNSDGGKLVLGVTDNREILGLSNDFATLKRPTSDGFEQHFTHLFNTMIGPEFRHCVKLGFEAVGGVELCVVHVTPGERPVYLKAGNAEYFYVRTGNATTPLKLSEIESYARSRWPGMRTA